jgi:hypothetical protein
MVAKKAEGNEDQRRAAAREARREGTTPSALETTGADLSGRDDPDYTEDPARVFTALTMAQEEHNGEAVYLDEIADGADLPESETRDLLHDLTTAQHLVAELEGSETPDQGPSYEVRPSL